MRLSNLSIFIKIILAIVGVGLFLTVTLSLLFFIRGDKMEGFRENIKFINHYLDYVCHDLETGSKSQLKELENKLNIDIIGTNTKSANFYYRSTINLPNSLEEFLNNAHYFSKTRFPFPVGDYEGRKFLVKQCGTYKYAFISKRVQKLNSERFMTGIFAILLVVTTLFFFYMAIRRIISPIRSLNAATHEIASGNFNIQLPYKGKDELHQLAQAFTSMSQKVRLMINSKEQLLTDVSHELRSPITRMKLGLEIMQQKSSVQSFQSSITELKEDVEELETLVNQILTAAKIDDRDDLEKINFTAITQDLLVEFRPYEDLIDWKLTDEPIFILASKDKLKIIMRNLISNAIKYGAKGEKSIVVNLSINADNAVLIVHDSGPGIPMAHRDKIFEPFYRIDFARQKETGGLGLGLNIVKRVIHSLEGEISVENSEYGARFKISIPLSN